MSRICFFKGVENMNKEWLKEKKYHKILDRHIRRWERRCGFNRKKVRENNIQRILKNKA